MYLIKDLRRKQRGIRRYETDSPCEATYTVYRGPLCIFLSRVLNAATKIDVNMRGRKITNGVRLWKIGVSILKSELYGWLKQTLNEDSSIPHGYLHFSEYNTEYFKQLTAVMCAPKFGPLGDLERRFGAFSIDKCIHSLGVL